MAFRRYNASTEAPAIHSPTVAGRCKPMKVEKPKKPRVHKVKQGTPPKLSASQKRKLVRLYVLTNLSWEDISSLILHFGSKDIKKRALQYTLQGFFSSHYNLMRPKDADARRKRMSQIQRCRKLRPMQKDQSTGLETSSQPVKDHLPSAIDDSVHYFRETPFHPTAFSNDTTKDVQEDESIFNKLKSFINVDGNEALDGNMSDHGPSLSPSSHTITNHPPQISQDQAIDIPFSYSSTVIDPSGVYGDHPHTSRVEDSLQYISLPMLDPSPSSTSIEEYSLAIYHRRPSPSLDTLPIVHGYNGLQGTENLVSDHGSSQDFVPDGMNGDALTLGTPQPQGPSTELSLARPRARRLSGLKTVISRLSKWSLTEKNFIEDALKHLSASTFSSFSSSRISRLSITSKSNVEELQGSHAHVFHPIGNPTGQSGISDLPGNFITSSVNTFTHHICCETENPQLFRPNYCGYCCRFVSRFEMAEIGVPLAVIQFKREYPVNEVWSPESMLWVDRFGNTALHIAAALGFKYPQIRSIIENGVSVHKKNSAGQTFMHVLNPQHLAMEDMLSLRADLERRNFNFHQLDVRGRTFLDSFEFCGLHPLQFARCWLEPFLFKDIYAAGYLVAPNFIREIFDSSGGSQEQWYTLGWSDPTYQILCPWFRAMELYENSEPQIDLLSECSNDLLSEFRWFEDPHGRNLLHRTADDFLEPTHPKGSQQLCAPAARLNMVSNLLSVGVNVDHHDKSGETPLIAHVRSIPTQDYIIEELLKFGADTNARNKKGEAALHIAVKSGNIAVTKALLGRGANVHVRDTKGRGVLAVAESAQRRAKDDSNLYARILACLGLAIDAGAIASPNLFDEWSLPEQTQEENHRLWKSSGSNIWPGQGTKMNVSMYW